MLEQQMRDVNTTSTSYRFLTALLRVALIIALVFSGWLIYSKLPHQTAETRQTKRGETTLQIVLRPSEGGGAEALDIPFDLYPFDIVAARHEFFTERRAGTRFDDFLKERMKGRTPITAKLDKHGQAFVVVGPGSWWLHAQLPGNENLEWRLPIDIVGPKQTIELTSQNVYTRTKSF
jgi:hypothetical protein